MTSGAHLQRSAHSGTLGWRRSAGWMKIAVLVARGDRRGLPPPAVGALIVLRLAHMENPDSGTNRIVSGCTITPRRHQEAIHR